MHNSMSKIALSYSSSVIAILSTLISQQTAGHHDVLAQRGLNVYCGLNIKILYLLQSVFFPFGLTNRMIKGVVRDLEVE